MFIEEENKLIKLKKLEKLQNLSISQQLVFFTKIMAKNKESLLFNDRKKFAIIGALVADLLLKKKAGLVNNKVVIINTEKATLDYLNKLIDYLQSLEDRQYISEIIFKYQEEANQIEDEILHQLIEKELLEEKKGFIPFLFPTELQAKDQEIISQIKTLIHESLEQKAQPEENTIYLLTIIDAINILRQFFKTKEEYNERKKRLVELMDREYIAKMIYKAIKEQPEPELPPASYMPPFYFTGGLMRF